MRAEHTTVLPAIRTSLIMHSVAAQKCSWHQAASLCPGPTLQDLHLPQHFHNLFSYRTCDTLLYPGSPTQVQNHTELLVPDMPRDQSVT